MTGPKIENFPLKTEAQKRFKIHRFVSKRINLDKKNSGIIYAGQLTHKLKAQKDAIQPEKTRQETTSENQADSEPAWMKFAGIFENDPDFEEIMNSIRAERDSDDDSEVDPSCYL